MEDSEPLAIESFSESWLLNSSFGFNNEESFLSSMDDFSLRSKVHSRILISERFIDDQAQYNFKFDIPSPDPQYSPSNLVHADDLFSNGLLKPTKYVNPSKDNSMKPTVSLRNGSSSVVVKNQYRRFLDKLQKSSEKIVYKCLRFLIFPLSRRVNGVAKVRKRNRVTDIRNNNSSLQRFHPGKPQPAAYTMVEDWSNIDDAAESPIYDAVLHCKRSIG